MVRLALTPEQLLCRQTRCASAAMVVRDELLLIFDLTSTLLRAGVGVHDLIRGPLIVRLQTPRL